MRWDGPRRTGGSAIVGYGVQHRRDGDSWASEVPATRDTSGTGTSHTITGLTNGQRYHIRVTPCNQQSGCLPWSEKAGFSHASVSGTPRVPTPTPTPTPVATPGPVRELTLTPGDHKLGVRWLAPASPGGHAISRYQVEYKPAAATGWTSNPEVTEGMATTVPVLTGDRTPLTNGAAYHVQVRACNGSSDSHCGNWTQGEGTPDGRPQKLDVAPRAERRARVTWAPVAGASGFVVQVRPVGSTSDDDWQASRGTHYHLGAGVSLRHGLDFDLDTFVTGGLAAHPGYQLQVQAITGSDSDGNDVLSEPSETIVIMDTPIRTVNGDVRDGAVDVNWRPVEGILGDGYAGGSYRFRSRLLGGDHTSLSWRPGSETAGYGTPQDTLTVPAGSTSHPIRGLLQEQIYAIQLRYEIELDTEVTEATTKVFAVRDAYVWPSERAADDGERVASYPLNFGLSNAGFDPISTYEYRLCTDTFPELDPDLGGVGWSDFLNHGIDQWWIATDGLVRRVHNTTPCSTYRPVVDRLIQAATKVIGSDGPETDAVIQSHIEGFVARTRYSSVLRNAVLRMAKQTDAGEVVSEVFMFERNAEPAIFDMARDVAIPQICGNDGLGCAILRVEHESRGWIVDVALRKDGVFDPWYIRDDGTREAVFVPELPAIAFNRCYPSLSVNQGGRFSVVYSTLVHEVGHVFGIGWGTDSADQTAHHPNDDLNDESALVGGLLQICSPTPLDVLAVQAKYQTTTP